MKWSRWIVSALVVLLAVIGIDPILALANPDAVETGRLLAILLDAGRVTVGANQPLINDQAKGDKGFTPEVFEKQLNEKFKERTGVDLGNLILSCIQILLTIQLNPVRD